MIKCLSLAIALSSLILIGCTESGGDADTNNEQNDTGGLNTTGGGLTTSSTSGTGTTGGLTTGGTTSSTTSGTTSGTSGGTTSSSTGGTSGGTTGSTSGGTSGGNGDSLSSEISNGASLNSLTDYWSCSFDVSATETINYSIAFADDTTGTYSDDLNEGLSVSWSASNTGINFTLGSNSPNYGYRSPSFNSASTQFTSDFQVDGNYTATHVCDRIVFENNGGGGAVTAEKFFNGAEDLWGCENTSAASVFILTESGQGAYIDSTDSIVVGVNSWGLSGIDLIMNFDDSSDALYAGNQFSNANTFSSSNARRGNTNFGAIACRRIDVNGNPISSNARFSNARTQPLVEQLLNKFTQ